MSSRLPSFYAPVTIDVEGEITKTRWIGTFNVKRVLTHRDRFTIENYYAEYLRDDSKSAFSVKADASSLAELRVRIQSGTSWWEDSNYGLDLVDEAPIMALLQAVKKAKEGWDKELETIVAKAPKERAP